MLNKDLSAEHHLSSSLIWDESPEDLENSTEWIFQGYLIFGSDGWHTARTYEAEVLAVVEQQYVQHTYQSVAEPDSDILKLLIQGCVQANSASQRQ